MELAILVCLHLLIALIMDAVVSHGITHTQTDAGLLSNLTRALLLPCLLSLPLDCAEVL